MEKQLKNELLSVDLSGINFTIQPKHLKSVELIKRTSEMLISIGIPFKFSDLADAVLYSYSQIHNDDLCIATLLWHFWGVLLDDHLMCNTKDYSKWHNILDGKECPADGIVEKLYKLFLKSANKAFIDPKSLDEFLRMTKKWLESAEKLHQLSLGEISQEKLIETRLLDIGVLPGFYIVQIDAGLQVTKELESDENWAKLRYYSVLQVIIINDLFSLKKEIKDGEGQTNYVYVKMKNTNLSAQEAVQQLSIEAEVAEQMARYHGQKLKDSYEIEGLDTYVDGLITVMVGSLYWSATCTRYNDI